MSFYKFKNGHIATGIDGHLKAWSGEIIRKRKGKIPLNPIRISRYFKGFSGDAYVVKTPDEGKTLRFQGSGQLKYHGSEVIVK